MPPSDPAASARRLYEGQVAGHLLALREALVRHDENLAAHVLLDQCVPYYLRQHPDVVRATEEQRLMVEHLLDPNVYEAYYAANPYERPFEDQYGGMLTVETADRIPRVRWLAERLSHGTPESPLPATLPRLLDLGCNDGAIGAHLLGRGLVSGVVGIDLAHDCVERAKGRGVDAHVGRVEHAASILGYVEFGSVRPGDFDAVSCFEVLEHVLDPIAVLKTASDCCASTGRIYLSTPLGATEQGDLPNWAFVEHKGHVRAWLPEDFERAVKAAGLEPVELVIDPDGLMLMEAKHA